MGGSRGDMEGSDCSRYATYMKKILNFLKNHL